jgi:hypothetical protein
MGESAQRKSTFMLCCDPAGHGGQGGYDQEEDSTSGGGGAGAHGCGNLRLCRHKFPEGIQTDPANGKYVLFIRRIIPVPALLPSRPLVRGPGKGSGSDQDRRPGFVEPLSERRTRRHWFSVVDEGGLRAHSEVPPGGCSLGGSGLTASGWVAEMDSTSLGRF